MSSDAKFIWFSRKVNDAIGSWITPPNDTNKEYGLPAKKASPPNVKLKVVVLLFNC